MNNPLNTITNHDLSVEWWSEQYNYDGLRDICDRHEIKYASQKKKLAANVRNGEPGKQAKTDTVTFEVGVYVDAPLEIMIKKIKQINHERFIFLDDSEVQKLAEGLISHE